MAELQQKLEEDRKASELKSEKEKKLIVKLQLHVQKCLEAELQKSIEEAKAKEAEMNNLRAQF